MQNYRVESGTAKCRDTDVWHCVGAWPGWRGRSICSPGDQLVFRAATLSCCRPSRPGSGRTAGSRCSPSRCTRCARSLVLRGSKTNKQGVALSTRDQRYSTDWYVNYCELYIIKGRNLRTTVSVRPWGGTLATCVGGGGAPSCPLPSQ